MPLCLTVSLTCCRVDVSVAISVALVFCMLVVISCMTLYYRRFWIFLVVVCFNIFLLIRLRASRQTLARKRERRLPLSIWLFSEVNDDISHDVYWQARKYKHNLVFHEYSYLSAAITSVGQKELFPTFLGRWYSSSQPICTSQVNLSYTCFTCNTYKIDPRGMHFFYCRFLSCELFPFSQDVMKWLFA